MNVIGLDLSLNGTGISIGDHINFTQVGNPALGDRRLWAIQDVVRYYASCAEVMGRADLAVIEGLPFGNNDRSVALVHGAVRAQLAGMGIPFAYVYPTTLKVFATGDSKAGKPEMMAAAVELGADERIDSDQADAWWLRRMGLAALSGGPGLAEHQAHALSVVEWPMDIVAPYGAISARKPVTKKCGHKVIALKNGGDWLHPFTVDRCDKPPK